MRKLLLCDLDFDLDLDFYSGVLRIHFLMEREKVLSICSTNNSTGSQLYLSLITEHTRYVLGKNRNSTTLDKLLHGRTKTSLSRTETEEEWVKSPPALLPPLPHRHQGENAGWTILAIYNQVWHPSFEFQNQKQSSFSSFDNQSDNFAHRVLTVQVFTKSSIVKFKVELHPMSCRVPP